MTTVPGRRSSTFTRLLRHGFTDPSAAERLLDLPALSTVRTDSVLLDALGATADPDLALRGLVRLVEAVDADERRVLLDTLITAKPLRDRLLGVLGASEALGDHLARHPATGTRSSRTRPPICTPEWPSSSTSSPRPAIRIRCASPTGGACWP